MGASDGNFWRRVAAWGSTVLEWMLLFWPLGVPILFGIRPEWVVDVSGGRGPGFLRVLGGITFFGGLWMAVGPSVGNWAILIGWMRGKTSSMMLGISLIGGMIASASGALGFAPRAFWIWILVACVAFDPGTWSVVWMLIHALCQCFSRLFKKNQTH